jgi:hypothetical protein
MEDICCNPSLPATLRDAKASVLIGNDSQPKHDKIMALAIIKVNNPV